MDLVPCVPCCKGTQVHLLYRGHGSLPSGHHRASKTSRCHSSSDSTSQRPPPYQSRPATIQTSRVTRPANPHHKLDHTPLPITIQLHGTASAHCRPDNALLPCLAPTRLAVLLFHKHISPLSMRKETRSVFDQKTQCRLSHSNPLDANVRNYFPGVWPCA